MSVPSSFRLAAVLSAALLVGCAASQAVGAGPVPADCGQRFSSAEILARINQARAAGHRCGARAMAPVHALKWDRSLQLAAAGHSLDMAKRNYFEHASPDGRSLRDRTNAQNYRGRFVGENIAAGSRNLDDAMQMWLSSAGHCQNIMDPGFQEVGVACAQQPGSQWGTYWTMVLGRR
jgi:uncharacterized protein YkwD